MADVSTRSIMQNMAFKMMAYVKDDRYAGQRCRALFYATGRFDGAIAVVRNDHAPIHGWRVGPLTVYAGLAMGYYHTGFVLGRIRFHGSVRRV